MPRVTDQICIGAVSDDQYAPYLGVVITSLIKNNPTEYFNVFILDAGISKENIEKLNSLSAVLGRSQIRWLYYDPAPFATFKVDQYVSLATYYRIALPLLIPESYLKFLYLDCDLLILGRIRTLWDTDLNGHVLAAVQDPGTHTKYVELGISSPDKYFNAGVMLVDLVGWRKENVSSKVISYIQQHRSKITYWDQDGLNAILNNRWKSLNERWNKLVFTIYGFGKPIAKAMTLRDAIGGPKILHFAFEHKPWLKDSKDPLRFLYLRYLRQTPWEHLVENANFSGGLLKWVVEFFPLGVVIMLIKFKQKFQRLITLVFG